MSNQQEVLCPLISTIASRDQPFVRCDKRCVAYYEYDRLSDGLRFWKCTATHSIGREVSV